MISVSTAVAAVAFIVAAVVSVAVAVAAVVFAVVAAVLTAVAVVHDVKRRRRCCFIEANGIVYQTLHCITLIV